MKTFKQIQEVMSMTDMNKVAGGTEHQRKIAQDRQRKREAKDKGFDPKKPVLNDTKPSPTTADSSALAKRDVKALPPADRKPDVRKSQLGKWSQGIKANPSAITKAKETKPVIKDSPVDKVKVKDVTPKKPVQRTNTEYSSLKKPEDEKGKGVVDTMKKKKKTGPGVLGKAKNLGKGTLDKLKKTDLGATGISTSGNLEGLSGTQSYD